MPTIKEILRFEHKESSIGPYNNQVSTRNKLIQHYINIDLSRQPLWDGNMEEEHYFGFLNMDQLINWFTNKELEWLFENDYNLKVYQIDSSLVDSSYHQCVFIRKNAIQLKVVTTMEEFEKFFFGDNK